MTNDHFMEKAMTALATVIDPELGVNLVALGLIYDVTLTKGDCVVTMTLTIAGCPLTEYLYQAITKVLMTLPEVNTVHIDLVWEPAWSVNKMSRQVKLELGIHG